MQPVKLKRASVFLGPPQKRPLERHLLWLRLDGRLVRGLLFLNAVELADGTRLHLPHLEQHGIAIRYGLFGVSKPERDEVFCNRTVPIILILELYRSEEFKPLAYTSLRKTSQQR
jgi:hypothetical protein